MRLSRFRVLLVSILAASSIVTGAHRAASAPRWGTPEQRAELFEYIVRSTMERTAFSPYTPRAIGQGDDVTMARYVRREMGKYRDELVAADSDESIYYALAKISNTRWDSHLRIRLVDGGLAPRGVPARPENEVVQHAPIKFKPDYSNPAAMTLFVSDWAKDFSKYSRRSPHIADRLVAVNGTPIAEFIERFRPYFGESSLRALWWRMAEVLPVRSWRVPSSFYAAAGVTFRLQSTTGELYAVTLPYLDYEAISWLGHDDHYTGRALSQRLAKDPSLAGKGPQYAVNLVRYRGFDYVLSGPAFDVYVARARRALLLKIHSFHSTIRNTLDQLLAYAEAHQMLDYGVIVDMTRAVGGDLEEYTLQRLQPEAFKLIHGNLRISDITPALVGDLRRELASEARESVGHGLIRPARQIASPDDGSFLLRWLERDVAEAMRTGQAYTNTVQFKNQFLAVTSDGFLYPPRLRLSGPIVLLTAPHSCSGTDQFAAMFIDNGLGLSVGMPEGGCSNTWEWDEVLVLPSSKRPLVKFSWTVGHSIRPNGEVLEGNSAVPQVLVPLTRENYRDYYTIVLGHAFRYIDAQRDPSTRAPTLFERMTHEE